MDSLYVLLEAIKMLGLEEDTQFTEPHFEDCITATSWPYGKTLFDTILQVYEQYWFSFTIYFWNFTSIQLGFILMLILKYKDMLSNLNFNCMMIEYKHSYGILYPTSAGFYVLRCYL